MKYVVQVEDYGDLELHSDGDNLTLGIRDGGDYNYLVLSETEFRDLRKAVGYVWEEVHSDGE